MPCACPEHPVQELVQDLSTSPESSPKAAGFMPEPLMPEESGEAMGGRLLGYMAGSATVSMIYLADQLGLLTYLAERPAPETTQEIAAGTGLAERWLRELLHQLASAGIVSTDKAAGAFWLSPAQAATLAHEEGPNSSPFFMAGFAKSLVELASNLDAVKQCFYTGVGMKYDQHGDGLGCGICRVLAPWTRHNLLSHVQKIPGLHERLEAGAMVADVGCGYGLALQVLADAYPNSTFHGFDISAVALAAAAERTAGRKNVALLNPDNDGERMAVRTYDFVLTLDSVHDMTAPEPVLAAVREALKDDAIGYLVADFKSTGSPAGNMAAMGPFASLAYGMSTCLCMSNGLSEPDGRGLGTLGWHPQLAQAMLKEAGFGGVDILDWESPTTIFYLATA